MDIYLVHVVWYRGHRLCFMDTDFRHDHGIGEDSDSDESDVEVGAQAPPLTKQISNILNRYPEGGQILKVTSFTSNIMLPIFCAMLNLRS